VGGVPGGSGCDGTVIAIVVLMVLRLVLELELELPVVLARSPGSFNDCHISMATEIAVADTTIRMFLIACRDCVSLSPLPGAAPPANAKN